MWEKRTCWQGRGEAVALGGIWLLGDTAAVRVGG